MIKSVVVHSGGVTVIAVSMITSEIAVGVVMVVPCIRW